MYLKNEKGVTLMALTITIIVMLILSSVIIRSANTNIDLKKRDNLYSDIDNLDNKIKSYYLKWGDIPVISKKYCDKETLNSILSNNANLKQSQLDTLTENNVVLNPNDNNEYYIIDLEKMEGLTLNYGYGEEYKKAKQNIDDISTDIQDVYIINKASHQIYYPKGIFIDNYMYYCYDLNINKLETNNIIEWNYTKGNKGKKTILTDDADIQLNKGESLTINGTISSNTDQEISWTNSNDDIATMTISENKSTATLTGISVGTTTIMSNIEKANIKFTVTVKEKINIEDSQEKVISSTETTTVTDKYGNEVKVPAGFKITTDASTVPEGIVIEDVSAGDDNSVGNQFVWIPVGIVYTDEDASEANAKMIELGRYTFNDNDGSVKSKHLKATDLVLEQYTEDENIETTFVTSAKANKGYYIGRYEAGDAHSTVPRVTEMEGIAVCKADQFVYDFVNKTNALTKSQQMYTGKNFKSDLINSFAWDTALIFIQTFGQSDYSITYGKSSISTGSPQKTGKNKLVTTSSEDKQLNIFDMAGNVHEWTTENSFVFRGDFYNATMVTSARYKYANSAVKGLGFRPILYL